MLKSSEDYILGAENLVKTFGGLTAVSNFSFKLKKREILGLIGPNGAGKTTVFNLLTGILKLDNGRVLFGGENLAGKSPHTISNKGLVRTFQNIRLMRDMTVRENLLPAFHDKLNYSLLGALIHSSSFNRQEIHINEQIDTVLTTLGIFEYVDTIATDLPYGTQRRVEIARALCLDPQAMLLDEPTAGLNPSEIDDIIQLIHYLWQDREISLIVIEHNMRLIMSICERIIVINEGKLIAEGSSEEIQNNSEVARVYLGERAAANVVGA